MASKLVSEIEAAQQRYANHHALDSEEFLADLLMCHATWWPRIKAQLEAADALADYAEYCGISEVTERQYKDGMLHDTAVALRAYREAEK